MKGLVMNKAEDGFTHLFLPVLVLLVVAGAGYVVYGRVHKVNSPNSSTANTSTTSTLTLSKPISANTASGVASNVDSITSSLVSGESTLNGQYDATDQSSDANLGTTATNVGGAYDASNY